MDWWPCQLSIFIGALLFWGPEGKLRTEQLDSFISFFYWRRKKKKKHTHIWRGKTRCDNKKKKSMAHWETEVKCFFKKVLLLKPFFAVDILQVFSIDCIWSCFCFLRKKKKRQLLTCVFEDDNDEKKKSYLVWPH